MVPFNEYSYPVSAAKLISADKLDPETVNCCAKDSTVPHLENEVNEPLTVMIADEIVAVTAVLEEETQPAVVFLASA